MVGILSGRENRLHNQRLDHSTERNGVPGFRLFQNRLYQTRRVFGVLQPVSDEPIRQTSLELSAAPDLRQEICIAGERDRAEAGLDRAVVVQPRIVLEQSVAAPLVESK